MLCKRYAMARAIEPDDVPHTRFGAEMARAAQRRCGPRTLVVHQTGKRYANALDGALGIGGQRYLQRIQQLLQRRLVVQRKHHVVGGLGDAVHRADGLAALRNARDECHASAKSHPREAAGKHPAGGPLPGKVAVAAHGKLHAGVAAGGQATKQVAARGAVGQFGHQCRHVGRGAIGMDQRCLGCKAPHPTAGQRRHTGKHAVLVGRQFQQHQRQRGLVEILGAAAAHPDAHGAAPVGDFGQLSSQQVEHFLRLLRVVVGDVEKAQRGCRSMAGCADLRAHLGQRHQGGHTRLRMGGVAGWKQFHESAAQDERRLSTLCASKFSVSSGWFSCAAPPSLRRLCRFSSRQRASSLRSWGWQRL